MKRFLCALLAMSLLLGVTVVASTATAADVLYGDINSDGAVNNRDLALLQQYINKWDVTIDVVAADVTADGAVNNRDLALLQQYINKWDVQLGPDEPEFPAIELPPVGYDIDGEGRILVTDIAQNGNKVTVTISNVCTNWITEETSCVEYICTDAEGNVLTLEDKYYGMVYFGMLEVGDSFTTTITLPVGTAKLEFGDWLIRYWSPWVPLN